MSRNHSCPHHAQRKTLFPCLKIAHTARANAHFNMGQDSTRLFRLVQRFIDAVVAVVINAIANFLVRHAVGRGKLKHLNKCFTSFTGYANACSDLLAKTELPHQRCIPPPTAEQVAQLSEYARTVGKVSAKGEAKLRKHNRNTKKQCYQIQ